MNKQHYIEYFFSGMMFTESDVRKVEDRENITQALTNMPKGSFGFRFKSRTEGELNGEKVKADFKDYSSSYYPGGTIMSLEDVKTKMPEEKILISNMKRNKISHIVRTRHRNCIPLKEGDHILPEPFDLEGAL